MSLIKASNNLTTQRSKNAHIRSLHIRTSVNVISIRPSKHPEARRRAVIVHANIFQRLARVASAWINGLVNTAEDPEKILDQVVEEMQGDLARMRHAAATVFAQKKQIENKHQQMRTSADEWLRRAELAVSKGEDDLAREALRRRKSFEDQCTQLTPQLSQLQEACDAVLSNTRVLEGKLQEARAKKETLKARAASAKTSQQVQEMLTGLSGGGNMGNAVSAFEKMEQKVMQMEAETEGARMLAPPGGAGDSTEAKFQLLEGTKVDDDLAALKRGELRSGGGSASGSFLRTLPPGRTVADALDVEIEDMRRRVQRG